MATAAAIGVRYRTRALSRRTVLTACALGGAMLTTLTVVVAVRGPAAHPGFVAPARALMVAAPIAVGLYAWWRRPADRFGPMLAGVGVAWFLTTLAESGSSVLYSTGRVAAWGIEVLISLLVLSFPAGRLTTRTDRRLVAATGLLSLMLFVPTALFVAHYPTPSQVSSCTSGCPDNAFRIAGEPAIIGDLVIPLRETLLVILVGAILARLYRRIQAASPAMRRTLAPVLWVGMARFAFFAAGITTRSAGATEVARVFTWLMALSLPVLCLAFLVGLLRARLHAAGALGVLGARLRSHRAPDDLRGAFADAFGDPTVQLAFPGAGPDPRWLDGSGAPVSMPSRGDGRAATVIGEPGVPVAAIVHDEALRDQQELIEAGGAIALMALENQRLAARVEASTRELRASRDRIAESADRERRRIERDLHDGAQQRLVALRIQLALADELVRGDPAVLSDRLQRLAGDVDDAIDEIRALAHGVYPSLLTDGGLAEALRAAARRSAVPARVQDAGIGRYPAATESALYFCALEALQNVAKHAVGATGAVITLAEVDGDIEVCVRDDGSGSEPHALSGQGMTNMRDRLGAVGGCVRVTSTPGGGTMTCARAPVRPRSAAVPGVVDVESRA